MKFSEKLQRELEATGHALADAARPIAMQYFRASGQDLENKLDSGFDPVTVADRKIEQKMREILQAMRPEDSIFGEEFGAVEGTSGLKWVLDPIDGTRGFISGTPTWGVLIAVGPETGPVLGIIDQPFTRERYTGAFGAATWSQRDGEAQTQRALAVRDCASLDDAILFSTFPEVGTADEGAAFRRVSEKAKLTRYGTDCYAYGLVAAGQVDLVVEAGLNSYDIQGPLAVIENAGGVVTCWDGSPAHEGGRVIAAGDRRLHAEALELLNR